MIMVAKAVLASLILGASTLAVHSDVKSCDEKPKRCCVIQVDSSDGSCATRSGNVFDCDGTNLSAFTIEVPGNVFVGEGHPVRIARGNVLSGGCNLSAGGNFVVKIATADSDDDCCSCSCPHCGTPGEKKVRVERKFESVFVLSDDDDSDDGHTVFHSSGSDSDGHKVRVRGKAIIKTGDGEPQVIEFDRGSGNIFVLRGKDGNVFFGGHDDLDDGDVNVEVIELDCGGSQCKVIIEKKIRGNRGVEVFALSDDHDDEDDRDGYSFEFKIDGSGLNVLKSLDLKGIEGLKGIQAIDFSELQGLRGLKSLQSLKGLDCLKSLDCLKDLENLRIEIIGDEAHDHSHDRDMKKKRKRRIKVNRTKKFI